MKNVIEKIVLGTYLPNGVFTAPGNCEKGETPANRSII